MLTRKGTAIDTHNLMLGQGSSQNLQSLFVLRYTVGRNKQSSINEQKVGIRGRKWIALFVAKSTHIGQGQQPIPTLFYLFVLQKFLLHGFQLVVINRIGIGGRDIYQCIIIDKPHKCIYMAIRIIPLNRSMLYIDNLLRPQRGRKQAIQSRHLLGKDISIRLCKATTSSYHLASTIGIYRTAL